MARVKGATARTHGSAAAPFPKSQVDPDVLAEFRRARDARKCSFSILTEELLSRAIYDTDGRLVGLRPDSEPQQQEMPLKTA